MCGIAGQFLCEENLSPNQEWFLDSTKKLRNRGPDSFGNIQNNRFLGSHTRLAIIDLSENASQPFTDGNYTLLFNGEIYNFKELAHKYKMKNLLTRSDTEVLFEFLKLNGVAKLSELRGMFAFAFYDHAKSKLVLGRDHTGQKPLYYGKKNSIFHFSSSAIHLAEAVGFELSKAGFEQYNNLQFNFGGKTLFKQISELPAAHYLEISGNSEKLYRFWSPIPTSYTDKFLEDELEFLLDQAVSRTLISDVPIGITMSGGLDSSLVAGIASKKGNHSYYHGRYFGEEGCDESSFALKQAKLIKSKLNIIELSSTQFDADLENTLIALGLPTAGPGAVGQYAVAREISRKCKVSLGGQGGDELFGGYARYYLLDPNYESHPILTNYEPLRNKLKNLPAGFDSVSTYFNLLYRPKYSLDIAESYQDALFEFRSWIESYVNDFNFIKPINFASLIDQLTFLPSLMHVEDAVTMAFGVEGRTPFLDVDLITYVNSLSQSTKLKSGPKGILKTISKKYVHEDILKRNDKMGFPLPLSKWIQAGSISSARFYEDRNQPQKWGREVWGQISIAAFKHNVQNQVI